MVLLVAAVFAPTFKAAGIDHRPTFLAKESITGQKVLERHFPAGSGTPTMVVAPAG